jgi:glycosyltransferase involved in cell wall biosynthesis
MPSVSVIVPNYNHSRYLPQRIESILGQTYQDFELILMDDCSTDDSLQILERYRGHPKVSGILYNQTNSGSTFRQWNKGVAQARGDYIWIAESDDWAEPDFLQTLIAVLENNPEVGIAYAQSRIIDSDGKQVCLWTEINNNPLFKNDFVLNGHTLLIEHMAFMNVIPNASAVVFRKKFFGSSSKNTTNYKLVGDWIFWINMLQLCKVAHVASPLNYFRTHSQNVRTATEKSGAYIIECCRVLEYFCENVYVAKFIFDKMVWVFIESWIKHNKSNKLNKSVNVEINIRIRKLDSFINYRILKALYRKGLLLWGLKNRMLSPIVFLNFTKQ